MIFLLSAADFNKWNDMETRTEIELSVRVNAAYCLKYNFVYSL